MTKKKGSGTVRQEPSHVIDETYSLWTAPPTSWKPPIERVPEPKDLKILLAGLGLDRAKVEEDEQAQAFKTPVTPDVLSQPTQG